MLQLTTRRGMTCRQGISHGVKVCDSCFRQNSLCLGSRVKAPGHAQVMSQSPPGRASAGDECWGVQPLSSACRELSRAGKRRSLAAQVPLLPPPLPGAAGDPRSKARDKLLLLSSGQELVALTPSLCSGKGCL